MINLLKNNLFLSKIKQVYREEKVKLMAPMQSINAVYDEELDQLLTSLELVDDLNSGKLLCYFCGNQITRDNLGSIFPHENDIKVCCTGLDCTVQLLSVRND